MISADNGKINIEGSGLDIICDYTALTKSIIEVFKDQGLSTEFIDFLLDETRELAKLNEEELNRKKRELEVQMIMKLFK